MLLFAGNPETLTLLYTKCIYPFPTSTPTLSCCVKICVFVSHLWHPSSLRPPRTVEKRLRLCSRHPRVTEEPSSRPAVPSCDQLQPDALTPLKDHQSPDDEPEEEVDPHCRLRGGGVREETTHYTQDESEWFQSKLIG